MVKGFPICVAHHMYRYDNITFKRTCLIIIWFNLKFVSKWPSANSRWHACLQGYRECSQVIQRLTSCSGRRSCNCSNLSFTDTHGSHATRQNLPCTHLAQLTGKISPVEIQKLICYFGRKSTPTPEEWKTSRSARLRRYWGTNDGCIVA